MILSEWRITYYGKNRVKSSIMSIHTPKSNEKDQVYDGTKSSYFRVRKEAE